MNDGGVVGDFPTMMALFPDEMSAAELWTRLSHIQDNLYFDLMEGVGSTAERQKRKRFRTRLGRAAGWIADTHSVLNSLERIERARIGNLLRRTSSDPNGSIVFEDAVRVLERLREAIVRVDAFDTAQEGETRGPPPVTTPAKRAIDRLIELWTDMTGQSPPFTYDPRTQSGRGAFVDLCTLVLGPIYEECAVEPPDIAELVRERRRARSKPASIEPNGDEKPE